MKGSGREFKARTSDLGVDGLRIAGLLVVGCRVQGAEYRVQDIGCGG
jgi:hypothetical protein